MGLIQDYIDSKSTSDEVAERSLKKSEKKEKKKKRIGIKIIKRAAPALETGGRKVVRAGERISKARVKFRKGKISKGFRVTL